MKFDKRYIFAASLVLAMGFGIYGCSEDDDKDKGGDQTQTTECTGENQVKKDDGTCGCKEGFKPDGDKCVADGGDTPQPKDCTGEHMSKGDDGCKCDEGFKMEGDKCVADQGDDPQPKDCNGEHMIKDSDGQCACEPEYQMKGDQCVKMEFPAECNGEHMIKDGEECKCEEGFIFDGEKCDTCGNGVLDADEVCDIVDGAEKWSDGNGTCEKWAAENDLTLSDDEQGKPGCASNCKAHRQNPKTGKGCTSTKNKLCGNGVIDDGEKCDIKDGKIIFAPSITDTSCKATYGKGEGNFVADGIPGCNATCDDWAKGTCHAEGEEPVDNINGIVSCKAEITADNTKATGKATVVTADSNALAKGKIVCDVESSNIGKALNDSKVEFAEAASGVITAKDVTTAFESDGTYSCVFYVEIKSGEGAVCSKDGTVSAASKNLSEYDGVSFEVTGHGTPTDGAIAAWNKFEGDVSGLLSDGIKVQEGSDTAAVMKMVFGTDGYKKNSDKPAFSAKVNSGKLRIQADSKEKWGKAGTIDGSHSYVSIATTALAKDAKLVIKLDSRGATLQINAADNKLKDDIKTTSGTFTEFTVDVPASTSDIRLYSLTADQTVIDIESVVIK